MIDTHTLDNGLRIVHEADEATQMVTVNILYKVGSRNEQENHTGFAHLFEHLMFGGSVHIPDYDQPLQQACGDNNAYTTPDYTNYYLTLPAVNVETAFWLESDRMDSLAFSPRSLEVQRKVVMEEFKQHYLTPPYGDSSHLMAALVYKKHPYRWPTIGLSLDHIAEADMALVKDFFFRFYAPNNAILSVVGNISMENTVRLAEKWFGPIPARRIDATPIPQEPEQTAERRLTVERDVPQDVLYMAFPIVKVTDPALHAADMISDILSAGQSCRLNRHLVEERRIFSTIDAYIQPNLDSGTLHICGLPAEGVTMEEAEAAVWEELDALSASGATPGEMEMAKNKYETAALRSRANRQQRAASLAYHEMLGSASLADLNAERYRAVTPDQFTAACRDTLRREKANILWYMRKNT